MEQLMRVNFVIVLVFGGGFAQKSDCPQNFQYQYNGGTLVGVMRFPNDLSGTYRLSVDVAIPGIASGDINIRRKNNPGEVESGADVEYYLDFPHTSQVPTVTQLVFNQRVYCSNQPNRGGSLTQLFASHFFSTSISLGASRPQNTYQQNNQRPQVIYQQFSKPQTNNNNNNQNYFSIQSIQQEQQPTKGPIVIHIHKPNQPEQIYKPTGGQVLDLEDQLGTLLQNMQANRQPEVITDDVAVPPPNRQQVVTTTHVSIGLNSEECGLREDTQSLVVHGLPTKEGQNPWLVAMFYLAEKGSSDDDYKFKCAGNLVTTKHVVTAAHCVQGKTSPIKKEGIVLVLGKHNIRTWAVKSTIREVGEMFIHPDYSQPADADIAVLTMSEPVQFSSKIRPACIWLEQSTRQEIVGTQGIVAGWGRTEDEKFFVPEPKYINMPVVTQEACLRADERFLKITSNRTFCAGERNGQAPCTGDSGGGFIMNRNGKWTLRGIISTALVDPETASCDTRNYVVFSDVCKFSSWIQRIVRISS